MKYVALLRGINVGGNSKVSMADLKLVFEGLGFEDVKTYINSGNVVFEVPKVSKASKVEITHNIETALEKEFKLPIKVVVKSQKQIEKVIEDMPNEWKRENDLRCYIAFVLDTSDEKQVEKEIDLKEGIDSLKSGPGVLYMSTKLSGLTKSSFTKLAAKKVYKEITIRNLNTTQKILNLMQT